MQHISDSIPVLFPSLSPSFSPSLCLFITPPLSFSLFCLCPKCRQFAVKHGECRMSSLTTRLGDWLGWAQGQGCKDCKTSGGRGGQAGSLALKRRVELSWQWQKKRGSSACDCMTKMIVNQSHILASTL